VDTAAGAGQTALPLHSLAIFDGSLLHSAAMSEHPSLLTRALGVFRFRAGLFLAVAAIPYATLYPALWWLLFHTIGLNTAQRPDLRAIWLGLTAIDKLEFLAVFFLWIALPYSVASRGLCRLASNHIENRQSAFAEAVREMAAFLPSALLLSFIVGCASFIGACFFLIPALFVLTAFALVVPAATVERLGPFAAIRRGLSLMTRSFGRLLPLFFCFSAIVFAALLIQGVFLNLLPHTLPVRAAIVAAVAAALLTPLAVFNICLSIILYESRTPASRPA
jgi:hypothetical protein